MIGCGGTWLDQDIGGWCLVHTVIGQRVEVVTVEGRETDTKRQERSSLLLCSLLILEDATTPSASRTWRRCVVSVVVSAAVPGFSGLRRRASVPQTLAATVPRRRSLQTVATAVPRRRMLFLGGCGCRGYPLDMARSSFRWGSSSPSNSRFFCRPSSAANRRALSSVCGSLRTSRSPGMPRSSKVAETVLLFERRVHATPAQVGHGNVHVTLPGVAVLGPIVGRRIIIISIIIDTRPRSSQVQRPVIIKGRTWR